MCILDVLLYCSDGFCTALTVSVPQDPGAKLVLLRALSPSAQLQLLGLDLADKVTADAAAGLWQCCLTLHVIPVKQHTVPTSVPYPSCAVCDPCLHSAHLFLDLI